MKRLPSELLAAAANRHPASAPAPRPARVVYVTPFNMPTNAYIEMQKALVKECGFEPRPLSVRHLLLEGGWRGLRQPHNLVMAQWIEMRAFRWRASHPRLSLRGFALFLFYMAVLRLARAPVVYVVHDHAVHDTAGLGRAASRRLIGWCRRVADHRIVHDPAAAAQYNATYLPHPLFWDRPGTPALPASVARPAGAPLRCAMLGAIRPYKAIDTMLEAWPKGRPLVIAGRSEPDLLGQLQAIVQRRGLQADVEIDATHQSDEAFSARLEACDVLILPHASDTAMVSGAFFEAIGRVPWLIARRSSFIEWAAGQFPRVLCFNEPHELPGLLDRIDTTRQATEATAQDGLAPEASEQATREAALQRFGWRHTRHAWAAFIAAIAVVALTIDL